MQPDRLERIGDSLIQHGPLNGRVYLMRLDPEDAPRLVSRLERLAEDKGYTKIFAKVPADAADDFTSAGYRVEAEVPGFFRGRTDGLFLGRYFADWRRTPPDADELRSVLQTARTKALDSGCRPLADGYELRPMTPEDAPAMAAIYGEVFESYPFPIHDPDYLRETMDDDVHYFGATLGGEPVALCSAEVDRGILAAEMTDFATLPEHLGHGLAAHLLARAEKDMGRLGLSTLYTIARAASHGMNITFARAGYDYSGTLPNNTNIAGKLESMNVWHKHPDTDDGRGEGRATA